MEELQLNKELFIDMSNWLSNKYSINTIKQYTNFLKKISKTYGVLNKDTMKLIMKGVKHQNQRATLKLINEYCESNNINFSINVGRIKRPAVKLPTILSPNEIKLMIDSAPYPYNLCIRCIFNMGAGLRISEIIKLRWYDINWIDWIKDKNSYGIALIKSGKGSKDRVVNIPKNLMLDLYNYAKEQNLLNEFMIPEGSMIFSFGGMEKNSPINRKLKDYGREIDEKWKIDYINSKYSWFRYNILIKHCEKALNKHVKIHSLRHSRATYLYEYENVPVEKIQVLLGHSSLNTTMLYTKVKPRSVFELIKDTKEL